MIKLLAKIFLTEIVLSVLPACLLSEYFESHLRENHPILDTIETFVVFILFQGLGCIGGILFLGMLYMIWTL